MAIAYRDIYGQGLYRDSQLLSLSLSHHIHTFIMGLDLVEDLENDFLRKLG